MRVFNQDKTIELFNHDLTKGQLFDDEITIQTEAIPFIEEQGYMETLNEFKDENGNVTGKEVKWIVTVSGQEAMPPQEKTEQIKIFIPFLEENAIEAEINRKICEVDELKLWFQWYDMQTIQHARTMRLGMSFNQDINALDFKAESKSAQIKNLKAEIASLEKQLSGQPNHTSYSHENYA